MHARGGAGSARCAKVDKARACDAALVTNGDHLAHTANTINQQEEKPRSRRADHDTGGDKRVGMMRLFWLDNSGPDPHAVNSSRSTRLVSKSVADGMGIGRVAAPCAAKICAVSGNGITVITPIIFWLWWMCRDVFGVRGCI